MEIELKDVITYGLIIISYVGMYWKTRVDTEKRIVTIDTQVSELRNIVNKIVVNEEEIDRHNQERFEKINEKLAELMTTQAASNVFLQENLKSLTKLVEKHDKLIDSLIQTRKND